MTGQRVEPPTAVVLLVLLACLVSAALVVAVPRYRPATDTRVDPGSYLAGLRHGEAHQRNPGPSGLSASPSGTRAECQLWFDVVVRDMDRASFLRGCTDSTGAKR